MRVAVSAQCRPRAGPLRWRRLLQQAGQVGRLLAAGRLHDDLGGDRADARQGPQRSLAGMVRQLGRRKIRRDLRRAAECADAVSRRARPFQLKRDLPQCLYRVHCPEYPLLARQALTRAP